MAAAFDAKQRTSQYGFVELLIDHLCDVGRALRGDLQAMLVLVLIGRTWPNAVRSAQAEGIDPSAQPPKRTSTCASRTTDVTGILRQTVRRKLAALEQRGWIARNDDGSFRLVCVPGDGPTVARSDLSDIDRRALLRVARLSGDLAAMVAAHASTAENDPKRTAEGCPEQGARNAHTSAIGPWTVSTELRRRSRLRRQTCSTPGNAASTVRWPS